MELYVHLKSTSGILGKVHQMQVEKSGVCLMFVWGWQSIPCEDFLAWLGVAGGTNHHYAAHEEDVNHNLPTHSMPCAVPFLGRDKWRPLAKQWEKLRAFWQPGRSKTEPAHSSS